MFKTRLENKASFFNTVPLRGEELRDAKKRASTQDALVLKIFEGATKPLTPSEVHAILTRGFIPEKTPLTSIRRSITSLTDAGLLVKTDQKRKGAFGVTNNTWCLARTYVPELLLEVTGR